MKRLFIAFIVIFLSLHFVFSQDVEGNLPFELSLDQVAAGFSSPTDIANAGDSRLFVAQRSGLIRILNADFEIEAEPFLDIDDRVRNTGGQSEQGLLALEFHHAYEYTGWFYVHYSDNDGNTVISRFSVDPNDNNKALPDSEKIIYTTDQPFANHNGGSIKFGPDEKLYIGLGDGGSANDPQNLAQNTSSPLGKMLRIDVDNGDPYSIPLDNPFVNDPNVLDEIWAIGLRNPWKFSFDKLTGDLWIGDVGQGQWEEINLQLNTSDGGQNYGWRCREGNHDAITSSGCNETFEPAIAEYNHQGFTHCSVTGGFVYRGNDNMFKDAPPIYLYVDYCSGRFFATYPESVGASSYASTEMQIFSGRAIGTFGEDNNGELYVAALNNGRVYRVNANCNIDLDLAVNPVSCSEVNDGSISVPAGLIDLYDITIVNTNDPQATIDADALAPGNYEVTVSRFGCERVYDTEVLLIERAPLEIEFDGAGSLTASFAGESYQWFLDGVLLPNETTQSIVVSESGLYSVEVLESTGCLLISEPIEIVFDATPVIKSITAWNIAPNPIADKLIMTLATDTKEVYDLSISDAVGKNIHQQKITVNGVTDIQIDMSKYANGVYLIMLSDGDVIQTKKVVKQ